MAVNISFQFAKFALHVLAGIKRQDFVEACKNPEAAQKKIKDDILKSSLIPFPEHPVDYKFYENKATTLDRVLFFETTSGSTGLKKKIPYTKKVLQSFENMFLLWAHDLVFHSGINLKSGKFFMSISPQIGENNPDDRKYLSPFLRFLLKPFLVAYPENQSYATGEEFLKKVLNDLIKEPDLEIISVWSPTYLLSLIERINPSDISILWPRLKLISCWTFAQAKQPSVLLESKFPGVKIQGKGLLLTEAPVTIPWQEANGHVPLVTETLIELMVNNQIIPLHEAKINKTYTVIISQFNGYLRYNTNDMVKVTGFYFKTPILEFIGRDGQCCDLAGEKLSENILRDLFLDVEDPFLFVPDVSHEFPRYHIFYAGKEDIQWDSRLRKSHHYNLARELGQLRPPTVKRIESLSKIFFEFLTSQGILLGDIKERVLVVDIERAKSFLEWIRKGNSSSHQDT